MKIINFNKHRPGRRPQLPPVSTTITPPAPTSTRKRKALLIGINYTDPRLSMFKRLSRNYNMSDGQLVGPHSDVQQMRDMLIKTYKYAPTDIVTMMDDGKNPFLHPTRENIIREIDSLVKDAKPGDHFFFHYAGHVEQIQNKNNTEEDGMDECLLPVDAKGKDKDDETLMIRDNELRQRLVDKLPVGSQLVAIFDSCHSASLLDLDHFRCNRVYVPWRNKGRRKSDTKWNENVRRDALEGNYVPASTKNVYQTKRVSDKVVKTRKSSIEQVAGRQRVQTRRLSMKSVYDNSPTGHGETSPLSAMPMCDSPIAIWACDGWCRPETCPEHKEGAEVISLGSCQDSQLSWEDRDGNSMTKALVKILKAEPNPSLKDLMIRVSHELHNSAVDAHQSVKKYKKAMKAYHRRGGKAPTEAQRDMDNFQDPQLASLKPLNLEKTPWNP